MVLLKRGELASLFGISHVLFKNKRKIKDFKGIENQLVSCDFSSLYPAAMI